MCALLSCVIVGFACGFADSVGLCGVGLYCMYFVCCVIAYI